VVAEVVRRGRRGGGRNREGGGQPGNVGGDAGESGYTGAREATDEEREFHARMSNGNRGDEP
jgi:hypothetical protein